MYPIRRQSVNTNAPKRRRSTVSIKWAKKEDDKLKLAVEKYGTQWTLIKKKYKFDRSINSLVKRWHGKLKLEDQQGAQNSNDSEQIQQKQQEQSEQEEEQEIIVETSKKMRKQQKKQQRRIEKKEDRKEQKKQQSKKGRQNSRSRRQSESIKSEKDKNRAKPTPQINSESQVEEEQDDSQIQQQVEESESSQNQQYVFQHNWKQYEDHRLREFIVLDKVLDWQQLANRLGIDNERQIRKRWQKHIYPSIIESRKIGGCLKYSEEEDIILSRGIRLGMSISSLRKFLPGRTPYSLDARRRRTLRIDEQQAKQHRYWIKKRNAFRFVTKRHQHLEKPVEELEFTYRSDSE